MRLIARYRSRGHLALRGCARLAAVAMWLLGAHGALAQVPDNRGLLLNPEDRVPPAYLDTLGERDRQRLEDAQQRGESFLPLFQGTSEGEPVESGAVQQEVSPAALVEPVVVAPARPPDIYRPYVPPGRRGGDAGSSELLDVLLDAWNKAPDIVRLRYPAKVEQDSAAAAAGDAAAVLAARGATNRLPQIRAGAGLYARALYAINSDYAGPVLLEVLEPPLAGAVVSGSFTLVRERLVLRLTNLQYRGRSVPVDAWAVGLDCACYGVAGTVNRHYFQRVVLPAAVRFAEGFLTALGQPSRSVSVQGSGAVYEESSTRTRDQVASGLGAAARSIGDLLQETAPSGPTVRIPRDTGLVVLFARPPGGDLSSPGFSGEGQREVQEAAETEAGNNLGAGSGAGITPADYLRRVEGVSGDE